jgi:hypothetical protein
MEYRILGDYESTVFDRALDILEVPQKASKIASQSYAACPLVFIYWLDVT